MMPAFSPGPWTTEPGPSVRVPRVGRRFRCTRLDLYEQCSDHITLKMPSSVRLGVRPISFSMRAYSSGVMECVFSSSGVIATGFGTPSAADVAPVRLAFSSSARVGSAACAVSVARGFVSVWTEFSGKESARWVGMGSLLNCRTEELPLRSRWGAPLKLRLGGNCRHGSRVGGTNPPWRSQDGTPGGLTSDFLQSG